MNDDLQRFEERSFAFVCDKLDAEEMEWMRSMLEVHPEWSALLDDDRRLLALSRDAVEVKLAEAPPLLSFHEMNAARAAASAPWWGARLAAALGQAWRQPTSTPWAAGAIAMLAVVAGLQTFRLEQATTGATDPVYRSAPPAATHAPAVSVVFADTLTLGQLRAKAAELQFTVIGGPDEQGLVSVIPAGEATSAQLLARLKADPAVLDAQIAVPAK